MGQKHARVAHAHPLCRVDLVVDADAELAKSVAARFDARWGTDPSALAECDAIVVAAPTAAHFALTLPLVKAGLPVLVEKPAATAALEVEQLCLASEAAGSVLMCGFVERFNPAVPTAQLLLTGTPRHIIALRHSPENPRATASVVHDLLIHDIDLSLAFFGYDAALGATGSVLCGSSGLDEIADCTITGAGWIASLSSSRLAQRKLRSIWLASEHELLELDLIRQDVTSYRHLGHSVTEGPLAAYRSATVMDIPFVQTGGEPLALQFSHFVDLALDAADRDAERASLLAPHVIAETVIRSSHRGPLPSVALDERPRARDHVKAV